MAAAKNRKQRRAVASAPVNEGSFDASSSIPLVHPSEDESRSRRPPPDRTLYEVIAERQGELASKIQDRAGNVSTGKPLPTSTGAPPKGMQFVTVDDSGEISTVDDASNSFVDSEEFDPQADFKGEIRKGAEDAATDGEEPIPPIIDTLLLSTTLTILHLTLAFLAAHQYAQEIPTKILLRESLFVAFPMLTLLVHLAHGHIVSFGGSGGKRTKRQTISLIPLTRQKLTFSFLQKLLFPPSLKTCVFLPLAVILGFRLMAITNEDSYYAVMKRAPALGTVWVWCILELSLGPAILGALGPLGWGVFWKGYGIF